MAATVAAPSRGTNNSLIAGIVLAVVTFWLFAQTTLNVAPAIRSDLEISESLSNIAVSITALFSGIFIVVAGGLADRFGRVKLTYVGRALSISATLFTALSGLESQSGPLSDLFLGKDRQYRHPVRSRDRAAVQRADGRRRDHHHRSDRAQG